MKNLFALICLIALMFISIMPATAAPVEVGWQPDHSINANANAESVFNVVIPLTIPSLDNNVSGQRSTQDSHFAYGQVSYHSYASAAGLEVTGPGVGQTPTYTVELNRYLV